jgi:hypothetical protein
MISLYSSITSFFSTIFEIANFLIAGGVCALLGYTVGRWISPIAGVLAGVIVMFTAVTGHYLTDDSDRVARLEFEKAKVEKDLAVIRAANETQNDIILSQKERLQANEKVLEKLEGSIERNAGSGDCVLHADELQNLRDLK